MDSLRNKFLERVERADEYRKNFAAVQTSSVVQPPITEHKSNGSCGSCKAGLWDQVLDFAKTGINLTSFLAEMAVDMKVTADEYERRKSICERCTACNPQGELLYRELKDGVHSCGVERPKKLLRISSIDGCGCYLELKWWGNNEKCPLQEPKW
jgi:hypothetical protein